MYCSISLGAAHLTNEKSRCTHCVQLIHLGLVKYYEPWCHNDVIVYSIHIQSQITLCLKSPALYYAEYIESPL